MIGSNKQGFADKKASLKACFPAVWNAMYTKKARLIDNVSVAL